MNYLPLYVMLPAINNLHTAMYFPALNQLLNKSTNNCLLYFSTISQLYGLATHILSMSVVHKQVTTCSCVTHTIENGL